MVGYLDVKIRNHIPGNKETVSKGGSQLKRIIDKYNLNVINANENKCKGKWTREQGEGRSIIDYVVTSQEYMETIKSLEIDEKQCTLYKIECQNEQIKKRYSDHNAIRINIDFISLKNVSKKKKMITRKGYKKYQTIIQEKEISKILEKEGLQESYNTWADEVQNTIKKVEKTGTEKPRKVIPKIQQKIKKLRIEPKTTKYKLEKHILLQRAKIMKKHILGKLKESRSEKISKVAESVNNNVDNGVKYVRTKSKPNTK